MKKKVKILPVTMRITPPKNIVKITYFLWWDHNTKREITIEGPYNETISGPVLPDRMVNIFKTLLRKSGLTDEMSYSDFLNFDLKKFPNLKITNRLL